MEGEHHIIPHFIPLLLILFELTNRMNFAEQFPQSIIWTALAFFIPTRPHLGSHGSHTVLAGPARPARTASPRAHRPHSLPTPTPYSLARPARPAPLPQRAHCPHSPHITRLTPMLTPVPRTGTAPSDLTKRQAPRAVPLTGSRAHQAHAAPSRFTSPSPLLTLHKRTPLKAPPPRDSDIAHALA
jgi:hypothetical protein